MVKKSNYECPLCNSTISKEKFERVTGVWKTIKQQEEEFKKKKQVLDNQIKKEREKWKKEKQELLKNAEQEAFKKLEKKHKKEISEVEKIGIKKGKSQQQKKIDTILKNSEKWQEKATKFEKKYKEALEKGKSIQELGFDFEKRMKIDLEKNFPEDKILPKGKKGDILQIIICKGREICRILYECKRTKWNDKFVTTLKEAVLDREGEYGVIITSELKKGKGGFCSFGDNIFAVNPEGIIDFIKFLREAIVKIESLKITQHERNILMNHLWNYMEGSKFGNSINEVIDKAKELKDILDKEQKIHEKIWNTRIDYYNKIGKNSLEIKEKVNDILKAKKNIPMLVEQKEIKNPPLQIISTNGEIINEDQISDSISYQERLEEIKRKFPNAYEPWSEMQDNLLKKLYSENKSINEISEILKRQPGAIRARLKKFGFLQ